jgi:hypothetical protein
MEKKKKHMISWSDTIRGQLARIRTGQRPGEPGAITKVSDRAIFDRPVAAPRKQ